MSELQRIHDGLLRAAEVGSENPEVCEICKDAAAAIWLLKERLAKVSENAAENVESKHVKQVRRM